MASTAKGALTPKQSAFVDEYLKDLNATAAYKRAGYTAKGNAAEVNAARLLRNAQVADAIQAAMNDRSERTNIDQDYVLRGIQEVVERSMQHKAVTDSQGNLVTVEGPMGETHAVYQFDAKSALKGYELLGKHLSLFTEKVDHTSTDGSMTPKPTTISLVAPDDDGKD